MAKSLESAEQFRETWKLAKKALRSAPPEQVQPHLGDLILEDLIKGVDAFSVLVQGVASAPRGLVSSRGAIRKLGALLLDGHLRQLIATGDAVQAGNWGSAPKLWTGVVAAQSSLAVLLRQREDARSDVLAELAEEEADAVAQHESLVEAVETLGPDVGSLREQVDASVSRLNEATAQANSSVQELTEWASKTRSESSSSVEEILSALRQHETVAKGAAESSTEAKSAAEQSRSEAKSLVAETEGLKSGLDSLHAKAQEALASVSEYESRLKTLDVSYTEKLEEQGGTLAQALEAEQGRFDEAQKTRQAEYQAVKTRIEDLLPGATSVALAESFQKQADGYDKRKRWFQWLFVVAILGLVGAQVALMFVHFDSWQEATVNRLLMVAALGWLALFMQRRYKEHSRIGEDYAFKAARAKTYEGYRQRASEVDPDGELGLSLLANTLLVISQHPHEVVDGAEREDSPAHEVADKLTKVLKRVVDRRSKQIEKVADAVLDEATDLPS